MDCTEFLSSFTDYRDGLLAPAAEERLERHLQECASCRRYRKTVEEGVVVLRSLPTLPVPDDFRPRLQHRIYHLEDRDALSGPSRGSGVSAVAAAGLALLLVVVAWSPLVRSGEPEVSLAPLVVQAPRPPAAELTLPASAFFDPEPGPIAPAAANDRRGSRSTLLLGDVLGDLPLYESPYRTVGQSRSVLD